MSKADRQTPLLLKTLIVAQTQLDQNEEFSSNKEESSHEFKHIEVEKLPPEQIRLSFTYFSYLDYIQEFNADLLKQMDLDEAVLFQSIPGKIEGEKLTILTAKPDNEKTIDFFKKRYQVSDIKQLIVSDQEIFSIISKYYENQAMDNALFRLMRQSSITSAHYVFSRGQVLWMAIALTALLIGIYVNINTTYIVVFSILQIIYFLTVIFRMFLTLGGIQNEIKQSITDEQVKALNDGELPIYSILIPVYQEPEAIPQLMNSLKKLDYPADKLDILILLELNDIATYKAAKDADPRSIWRFVRIPDRQPKTKPKACNYGLQFARGEFVTIYDAEDIPDPDQLKKSIIAHRKLGNRCLCVQAALNYFNVHENFITELFTLEYSYWFDYMLPGLEHYNLPIPLGGTSNHFNTALLRQLGAWDPYNTTEDADLGMRAFANKLKVGVINSTTLEEANVRYGNWLRQRSRWIKGYMQTALVYNRNPIKLLRFVGLKNWLAFQLLVAGTPLLFLINPIIWMFFIFWVTGIGELYLPALPDYVNVMGGVNLVIGNFIAIYFNMLGVFKRKQFTLLPMAFLNPFYWLFFHSVAAYKALWQLFTKPFYWEKTQHGLSQFKSQGN